MGQPAKIRKKYQTPSKPFEKDRIEAENKIVEDYGLKNKKEVWKADSKIANYRFIARTLLGMKGEQRDIRQKELIDNMAKIGLLQPSATLDDVLSLDINSILNRRLQTLVFKKGMSKSLEQSRQFIVHGLVAVSGRRMNVPSYIVPVDAENAIAYYGPAPAILSVSPVGGKPVAAAIAPAPSEPDTKPKVMAAPTPKANTKEVAK